LSRIVLNILTILAISAAPERLFSLANITISDRCNRLYRDTTEAIKYLKSWRKIKTIRLELGLELGLESGLEELLAKGRPVVVCDLWAAMMARAGWSGEGVLPGSLKTDKNPALAEMLYDGM
jgi:hypothetical protein